LPFFNDSYSFVEIVDVFEIHFHEIDVFFKDCGNGITGHARGIGVAGILLLIGDLDQCWEEEVFMEVEQDFDVPEDNSGVFKWSMWWDDIVDVNLKVRSMEL
jgi:hypothetical protein